MEFEWIGLGHSLDLEVEPEVLRTLASTPSSSPKRYREEGVPTCWSGKAVLEPDPEFRGIQGRPIEIYQRYHSPFSSFNPATVPILDDFLYEPFYQIMRQRLLADRMVEEGELGVDEAKVVVVVPEGNWAYRTVTDGRTTTSSLLAQRFPKLETVETVMRASLKDPDAQFDMVAPAQLLDGVARSLPDETVDWANYWRDRYGV